MYEVKKVLFFLSNTFCSNPILCPLYTGKIVIWCGRKCPLCTVYICRYIEVIL